MPLPKSIDLRSLRRSAQFAYYFRYPLFHSEFKEVRQNNLLRGYYAAKPLYGKLTPQGKVDRNAGFNGRIAIIFIPSPARSLRSAQLLFTRVPIEQITLPNGKRNWSVIHRAAEGAILLHLRR